MWTVKSSDSEAHDHTRDGQGYYDLGTQSVNRDKQWKIPRLTDEIFATQYCSHQPDVATECLKCLQGTVANKMYF